MRMSIEAEQMYREWIRLNGPLTPMTVVDLISWVITQARRHEAEGHRHITITDRDDLTQLGYELHQDGGYHRRAESP
jgi:hypothetical protein